MTDAQAVRIAQAKPTAITSAPAGERWLFIDGASAFGGHETMLLRWLEELQAQRAITPFLLARAGSQLASEAAAYATVLKLPQRAPGRFGRALTELRDVLAMARAALAIKPNLCIVAEGCLLSQPTFAFVARLFGLRVVEYVPLVQTSTSMEFGSGALRDAFVRHVYGRMLHGWITITREQADDFRRWARIERPILTLPNTVARCMEAAPRKATDASADGRTRVLVIGRIEAHQKGLDMLLEFLRAHPQLGDRIRLTFVGNGPYESHIAAQLAQDPALARWVALEGWSDPLAAIGANDVLLMTSRYEGVPLVMLEAMAIGTPVVAPALDGVRAFLDSQCLFAKGDMRAAFECIDRLRDPELHRETIVRNRREFERLASNSAFADAVKALTPQLRALGRSRPRSA